MKLSTISTIFAVGQAEYEDDSMSLNRHIQGDWVDRMMSFRRRREVDGEKGFRPLAAMIMYMQGSDVYDETIHNTNDFERELKKIEDTYTNYGCYCWIKQTANGLTGGGQTKDVTDHLCKELYFCYKCVNIDYSQNYSEVDYFVDFTVDDDGNRDLDCGVNAKQDAGNICECDKQFAKKIAETQNACANKSPPDAVNGEHCIDEQYRTAGGGGTFKPNSQCVKQGTNGIEFEKDKCCGLYPDRHPYDSDFRDCCRTKQSFDNEIVELFGITRRGECKEMGGEVVISKDGDPHNYAVVE